MSIGDGVWACIVEGRPHVDLLRACMCMCMCVCSVMYHSSLVCVHHLRTPGGSILIWWQSDQQITPPIAPII